VTTLYERKNTVAAIKAILDKARRAAYVDVQNSRAGKGAAVAQDSPPRARLGGSARRIVARFAAVACPPEVRSGDRTERLLQEFELQLGAMPAGMRKSIPVAFVLFDRAARLYPPARGRRFARLGDREADSYLRAVLARQRGGTAAVIRLLKGLVVMCYYELPDVKEQLGYRPGPYIAAVSRRRLLSYGPEIRAVEASVTAPEPGSPEAEVFPGPQAGG
jgi:hypothetical protein